MHRAVGLILGLALATGCSSSRLTFEPVPSRADVTASEVEAGLALYPFPTPAGRWGYMDAAGQVALVPAFDAAQPFSEGRAPVRIGDAYGYIDPSGDLVVPAQFSSAAPFSDGRALVTEGPMSRPRYGFIDPAGGVVVPLILPLAYSYSEGRALVRFRDRDLTWLERVFGVWRNESLGFIDRAGNVVFYLPGEAASFAEGLAPFSEPVFLRRGRWGYVRPDGSVAIPATFRGTAFRFSDGRARVTRDGRVGFIDPTGDRAFEAAFDVANAFSEGRAAVRVDDRWGYVDEGGALVIPARFTQAGSFSGGLAAVEVDGRWGYIAPDGTVVIEPTYREAQAFRGPLAYVTDETGPHYIDREGRPVRPDLAPR